MLQLYSGLKILLYILAARLILARLAGRWREAAFALLNLAGYYFFFVYGQEGRYQSVLWIYLAIVLVMYAAMHRFSESSGWKLAVAVLTPILFLIVIRYVPARAYTGLDPSLRGELLTAPGFSIAPYFLGISYLAFRCSHLVLEVRNGAVEKPGFWEYLGFCFFVPTMAVGPINAYSNYRRGFAAAPPPIPAARASLRVLVGAVKFLFLGTIFSQLSYSNLLLDDHYHPWIDLPVAAVFYYLYLYCNFAGVCDIAIGVVGLVGIPVTENFANPFAARSVKDFWNRWHITLSVYMRDMVFSPLSRILARLAGPANVNHAIALTILVVFLLIGIWHGVGWNYAAFGAFHAFGVIVNHYYTIGLKKWLGREGLKAYNANRWIHAAAVALTFAYVSASFFLFANTPAEMHEILSELR